MEITITNEGQGTVRFTVSGKVDERGAAQIKSRFIETSSAGGLTHAVFDFRALEYIGSAGIGKLLLFYKELAARGGSLRIIHSPPAIAQLFREMKLDTILSIS